MNKTLLFAILNIILILNFVAGLSDEKKFTASLNEIKDPNKTPVRSTYGIKSINPDDWNLAEIKGNGAGGIAYNYAWSQMEPILKPPPCGLYEEEYDGHCFVINRPRDLATNEVSNSGLIVTGILVTVPAWARTQNTRCQTNNKNFCAPDNGKDFARFAGWLAKRYNGKNGNGRIVEFVIHNEVNNGEWFNIGCGNGIPCDVNQWVQAYADNYNKAYDEIRKHQPNAPVLISLEHHFDYVFDRYLNASIPFMSGKTFLEKLVPKLGARTFSLAYHSYPPNLLAPGFSRDDLPIISFGNVNILIGWLITKFPNLPSAWNVYLTENGINGIAPQSDQTRQSQSLCKAFRNIINTPLVENFVYHRMKDHPIETASGLGLGLATADGQLKQAWATWALSNRFDVGKAACGFETLPYLVLIIGYKANVGHWTSTRDFPSDSYTIQAKFKLFRNKQNNTKLLFECKKTNVMNLVSASMSCENLVNLGPVGYAYNTQQPNTIPLVRCYITSIHSHYYTTDMSCAGNNVEGVLGYVYPG